MTVLDSSVLIDYLDGDPDVVDYVDDHADEALKAPHLVWYEVYLGELYTEGDPDFGAIDDALEWVTVVDPSGPRFARHAAELMATLHDAGSSLAFADGYVAATARSMSERLATRDADFDAHAVRREMDVDVV